MYKPLGDYVLVEIKKENLGGLVVPDSRDKKEKQKGIVTVVGEGTKDTRSGNRTDMFVKEGDSIIWQKYADADFSFEEDSKEFTLIKIGQIMGVEI